MKLTKDAARPVQMLALGAALMFTTMAAPVMAQSVPGSSIPGQDPEQPQRPARHDLDQQDVDERAVRTVDDLLETLNRHNTVNAREESKSYRLLFDAYLDLTEPPFPVNDAFNQSTIHNQMPDWSVVSAWAESNGHMREAILASRDKLVVGLPYGKENVPPTYQNAGIYIDIVRDQRIGRIDFRYFNAVRTISAYATAEVYRLMEAGRTDDAMDLAMAHIFVLRQFCDRDFLAEKVGSIRSLSEALRNLRDVFHVFLDAISLEQYRNIAIRDIPFLRPDRNRLLMPEADRHVAEARIRFVFNERTGQADPEVFARTFAMVQAAEKPLTRFGAARRWQMIATIHGSLDASLERLKLIYDDWWRRWRIEAYDPILEIETEFSRANPVRYAAVLYSMADIQQLFGIRNQLIAEVNGTAMAAGLCGYHKSFGSFPRGTEMIYAYSVRTRSDSDPHDFDLAPFQYQLIRERRPVDVPGGRVWIEPGMGLLYSVGQNHVDEQAAVHTNDGASGDVVLWPPIKALQREQGLLN